MIREHKEQVHIYTPRHWETMRIINKFNKKIYNTVHVYAKYTGNIINYSENR